MNVVAYPVEPKPDGEIQHEYTPAVELIQFGDGYLQRHVQGINPQAETYTLRYSNLNMAERNVIFEFVKERKGAEPFSYEFLTDTRPRLFIAPEGAREVRKNGEFYDIEVVLREVYDLGFTPPDSELADAPAVVINRGEDLQYNLDFNIPDDMSGSTISIYEANHPALYEITITMTDPVAGIGTLFLPAELTDQIPLGRISWFRIETLHPDGHRDVTPKIVLEVI